jgi:hypothetical protein
MFKRMLVAFVTMGLLFAASPHSALAQDIMGLSLRPTDAMTGAPGRGTVDIVRSNGAGNYSVNINMSGSADAMDLSEFEGAKAWVVWAVDMDGVRHNLGALDGELMLKDASADYMIARVYVTAEKDADAKQPSEPLFLVTLRQVQEVDTVASDEDATDDAAADEAASDEAADEDATDKAATTESAQPKELPTTGGPFSDLMVLLAVAAALLAGGLRLRTVRLD